MVRELEALRLADICLFSVAVSNRADENDVRGISNVPQLVNRNYFISPAITNLDSFSAPLAEQVFVCIFCSEVCVVRECLLLFPFPPRRPCPLSHFHSYSHGQQLIPIPIYSRYIWNTGNSDISLFPVRSLPSSFSRQCYLCCQVCQNAESNCRIRDVDLVFMVTSSSSVGFSGWQNIINFVTSIINALDVDSGRARVGFLV